MARRYIGSVTVYVKYIDERSPEHPLGARPDGYEWSVCAPGKPRARGFRPWAIRDTGVYAADSTEAYDAIARIVSGFPSVLSRLPQRARL